MADYRFASISDEMTEIVQSLSKKLSHNNTACRLYHYFCSIFPLRPILTIFFLLFLYPAFAQSDSFLQSLIDSAKAGVTKPSKSQKDSQKATIKTPAIRRDSVSPVRDTARIVKRDSIRIISNPVDSAALSNVRSDSTQIIDSIAAVSVSPLAVSKTLSWREDTAFANLLMIAYKKTNKIILSHDGDIHMPLQKDYLFYLLVTIVLLLAIIKQLFPKYFQNIFQLMFQASFRQKQTREQMMQQVLPSLLMNVLFVLVGGLFISLLADINKWLNISFWLLTVYSITLLALVYIFKYLVIKFMGWVFNAREQASTYGFIVFLVNKVIALALLPLLLLLAFSDAGALQQVTLTIAATVVILLLVFRYIVSLTIIRNTLSVHPLHFFIYLCAVELMPMLILYKVLFSFVGKSF